MGKLKYVLESAAAGAVITLATGLVNSTPMQLLGASWYGWPVTWVRKLVLAPQYNPWVVDWYGLLIDFIFWFVVALIVIYLIRMVKGNQKGASKSAQAKGRNK